MAGAALAFGSAEGLGGSGFIAAFLAGIFYELLARHEAAKTMGFIEDARAVLGGVTFLVFGAVLLGPALEHVSWQVVLYAVLSLTVVRMLPVAISLWGSHARAPTVLFHRLVRPSRARFDRLRRGRRGHSPSSLADDPHRGLSDRRFVGAAPRPVGLTPGPSLRRVVCRERRQAPSGDGERTCPRAPPA